jgi:hypothetical protein
VVNLNLGNGVGFESREKSNSTESNLGNQAATLKRTWGENSNAENPQLFMFSRFWGFSALLLFSKVPFSVAACFPGFEWGPIGRCGCRQV